MRHRKPFRATPIKLAQKYRRKQRAAAWRDTLNYLGVGVLGGMTLGMGSLMLDADRRAATWQSLRPLAVKLGLTRERLPQEGDHWSRCAEARAAGTAPIYAGEPGYREGLDGDSDGIACEPYRGM